MDELRTLAARAQAGELDACGDIVRRFQGMACLPGRFPARRGRGTGCLRAGLARLGGEWVEISGCGLLKPATLREADFAPEAVGGYAWGLGLERLAMLKLGLDDIRALWRPPYV